ncbi:helix-turn-helix domain-containing protein [Chitinophagaceae bacterium MMS25-I14]
MKAPYRLIFLSGSEGTFQVDLQQYELVQDCVFFISPGQQFTASAGNRLNGYIISFDDSLIGTDDEMDEDNSYATCLLHFFSGRQAIWLDTQTSDDMKDTIRRMLRELSNEYTFRSEILRRYFKILLVYLARQFDEQPDPYEHIKTAALVSGFISLLEKDYISKKRVAEYATDLSVTPNYLNQIVKKTTGLSAGQHIRRRVVLEAKRKAVYSTKCVKEIAYHLGFADPYHFSKFFKKETGVNFVEYRKRKPSLPCIPD